MMKLFCLSLTLSVLSLTLLGQEKLSVEKIWKKYAFFGESVDGFRSLNDGMHFSKISQTEAGQIVTKHRFDDYESSGEVLIPSSTLQGISIDDYSFNADETKALLITNTNYIYRRSFTAEHFVLDLQTNKLEALDDTRKPQMLAEYSPDGKMVSYIFENNLFVKDLTTKKVTQLTSDGAENKILNGTTDWVYEEEFAITKAYDWSPDSKWIAFLRFDESDVKEFNMTYYSGLYPGLHTFKYPKAGEDNSRITAQLIPSAGGKVQCIDLGDFEYIPRLKWSEANNDLIILTLNRHQNHLKYHLVQPGKKAAQTRVFFEEHSKTYVDIDNNLLILQDGKRIIRTSESDGFNHIYEISFDGNSKQITKGNFDVIDLYGLNENEGYIYYSSSKFGAINKSLHKIRIDGSEELLLSEEQGTSDAEFSTGMKYYVKTYSSANVPNVYTLCKNSGEETAVLENNFELIERLSSYKLSEKEFLNFEGAEIPLNGWMIKPHDFDPSKKYPVYMNVYGGPGSNMVSNSWDGANYMYHQLLAQNGYIVVSVDPRGTMYRGAEFKKSTYLNLGKLETEDIIAVGKELQNYSFVDKDRIGIMGWSYGGFMASLAITKGADVFKTAIAVAPVTSWRYYDNIYTERFMRTPQENASGYDENSPINFVNQLKGNYLLIHGSGDDNVHYQNAMMMIDALVKANKQFDCFIYPNKNHGIYGGNTRNHLFNMMLEYTLKNL
jgi:dipeptidyl-peptidase 4